MRYRLVILVFASSATGAFAQNFIGLGTVSGQPLSVAKDLSMDGLVVVGDSSTDESAGQAWRWTSGNGMASLGFPSWIRSVSSDGTSVVGGGVTPVGTGIFRQSQSGIDIIPNFFGSLRPAPAISGDGLTVVGTSDENEHAVRWRSDTGTVQLPDCNLETLPITFAGNPAFARGVNGDGSVVVGSAFAFVSFPQHQPPVSRVSVPFRWTPTGGTSIIRPGGQVIIGSAFDTSMDGRYILINGWFHPQDNPPTHMYRWDALTDSLVEMIGMNPNFGLGGFRLSGDGMAAISGSTMWNDGVGVRPISLVLTQAGCDFTGWTNLFATGIDMNASHLCGYGTNPTGQTEAWYATIPAPGVGGLLAMGVFGAVRRRR